MLLPKPCLHSSGQVSCHQRRQKHKCVLFKTFTLYLTLVLLLALSVKRKFEMNQLARFGSRRLQKSAVLLTKIGT